MKIDSLKNFSVQNNWVLVKPDPGNDKVILKSGLVLFLNTSYNKEQHAVTTGVVVRVPKALSFYSEGWKGKTVLDYITTQELKEGDKIIFHYMQSVENLREGRYIECQGEVYMLVKYDKIYCALRGEQVVPINGIVIVEADQAMLPKTSLLIPQMMSEKKSEATGVIRYLGTPLKGYTDYPHEGPDFDDKLKVGDRVMFRSVDSVPLQYELHQSIDKGKTLYRMHRRDILGVYDELIASIDEFYDRT